MWYGWPLGELDEKIMRRGGGGEGGVVTCHRSLTYLEDVLIFLVI